MSISFLSLTLSCALIISSQHIWYLSEMLAKCMTWNITLRMRRWREVSDFASLKFRFGHSVYWNKTATRLLFPCCGSVSPFRSHVSTYRSNEGTVNVRCRRCRPTSPHLLTIPGSPRIPHPHTYRTDSGTSQHHAQIWAPPGECCFGLNFVFVSCQVSDFDVVVERKLLLRNNQHSSHNVIAAMVGWESVNWKVHTEGGKLYLNRTVMGKVGGGGKPLRRGNI